MTKHNRIKPRCLCILFLLIFLQSPVACSNEEEAIAKGENLGIGSARLEGPKVVEVPYSRADLTLVAVPRGQ